jgi:hypothetical protein
MSFKNYNLDKYYALSKEERAKVDLEFEEWRREELKKPMTDWERSQLLKSVSPGVIVHRDLPKILPADFDLEKESKWAIGPIHAALRR